MRPPADLFSILLMFQFVSHSAQQMRHAKGLLEGLPCPEEFRDIQDIHSPYCARDRDHLGVDEFTRQFQEHVQPIQLGHANVCADQVRRPVTVQLKPLATVGSLRDLIPCRFKAEWRSTRMISSSSMIRVVAMARNGNDDRRRPFRVPPLRCR